MKKSSEESLENKLHLKHSMEEEFKSIISRKEIKEIVEDFYNLTNMGMAITDLKGNILISTGWQDICSKFHRINAETKKNCTESDLYLTKNIKPGSCSMYKCKNNMWDAVTPIVFGRKHMGNLYFGQFFFDDEVINRKVFEDQADKFGFDKTEYLAALDRVLHWSKSRIEIVMNFYSKFAQLISSLSFSNFKLTKTLSNYKQAVENLRVSEEKYHLLVDNSYDIIYTLDLKGIITFVSPRVTSILGQPVNQSIGKSFHQTIHPDDVAYCEAIMKKALETKQSQTDIEYRVQHIDGSWRWNKSNAMPLLDKTGAVIGFEGVARDITESKNIGEKLQQQTKAMEATVEGIAILNKKEEYTYLNEAHAKIYGYESSMEIIGKSWNILYDSDELQRFKNDIMPQLMDKSHWQGEAIGMKKDGSKFFQYISLTVLAEGGLICIVRDNTERKNKEAEILHLSYHDKLTGIYNRRFFEEEIKRLDTNRQLPLSVLMGDLNGLKIINDTFGHNEGDRLLKETAGLLKKICRSDDILARWGGDEFIILLPKTSISKSEEIVMRIKKVCASLTIQKMPLSLAIGIASKIELQQDVDKIILEAEDNMYKNKLAQKESSSSSIISALEQTLYEKSSETMEHAFRIKDNAIKLGKSIKLHPHQLDELSLLSSLHDIGKVAIPETILLKEGRLTEKEWAAIKRHPGIGFNIAQSSPQINHIAKFILACHENWDGSGYPRGLSGEAIPIVSRIIFIADAYDAMTNDRVYKKSISRDDAVKELKRCSGTQFDPDLVEKFIEII